ncbi:MAG TPA: hypothetical protein H9687_07745 [Firmicutes bacterium]|nr:hypothetical protein [Bacillota bacterium]
MIPSVRWDLPWPALGFDEGVIYHGVEQVGAKALRSHDGFMDECYFCGGRSRAEKRTFVQKRWQNRYGYRPGRYSALNHQASFGGIWQG